MNSQENANRTETSRSATRRPSHRQELSETQFPSVSNPSPRHAVPPPAFIPDTPAPWQLGRHSYYIPGTEHDQQSSPLSGQPSPGHLGVNDGGKWDTVHVQHQVNAFEEEGVHHVKGSVDEEELRRRLKARQVTLLSVSRVSWPPNSPSQISMIALGGTIGIGLVIGTGTALRQGKHKTSPYSVVQQCTGGPLGILLGYSFVGAFLGYIPRSLIDRELR